MSKRGRAERQKRKQEFWDRKVKAIKAQAEIVETRKTHAHLPRQERIWLQGRGENITVNAIAARQHTLTLYLGRSQGSGKPKKVTMPDRFLPGFMASGHENVNAVTGLNDLLKRERELLKGAERKTIVGKTKGGKPKVKWVKI